MNPDTFKLLRLVLNLCISTIMGFDGYNILYSATVIFGSQLTYNEIAFIAGTYVSILARFVLMGLFCWYQCGEYELRVDPKCWKLIIIDVIIRCPLFIVSLFVWEGTYIVVDTVKTFARTTIICHCVTMIMCAFGLVIWYKTQRFESTIVVYVTETLVDPMMGSNIVFRVQPGHIEEFDMLPGSVHGHDNNRV